MSKVAILYLCTGDYVFFWKNFFKSYEEKFLPNSEKHYFVWTDAENIYEEQHPRVHKIYKKCLGFPNETLMRFHTFITIEQELIYFDYIFFMNSNLICREIITEKEFLPSENTLTVIKHPAFCHAPIKFSPYERNSISTAYVPYHMGGIYVLGGINGGPAQTYLKMIHQLKENIDIDLKNNLVAIWHDESHFNKYIIYGNVYIKLLDSGYGYFEGWDNIIPYKKRIEILDKKKYIDIKKIKSQSK